MFIVKLDEFLTQKSMLSNSQKLFYFAQDLYKNDFWQIGTNLLKYLKNYPLSLLDDEK
jgi:hypothetical protein